MRRRLTKQEKFDIDLLYKPWFIKNPDINNHLKEQAKKASYLKFLDIFVCNCKDYFKNKEDFYLFLSDYGDIIEWDDNRVINRLTLIALYRFDDLINFVDNFKDYFDINRNCWEELSTTYECCKNREFIRKFKDKLNWNELTPRHRFDLEFLLEMKDYVDKNSISNEVFNKSFISRYLKIYFNENFEEIITKLMEIEKIEEANLSAE